MEALIIKETNDTPAITFDKENNRFEIKGKSLPENVNSFYEPVLKWLEQYFENPNPKTEYIVLTRRIQSILELAHIINLE